ncbi:hypothetical protein V3C99_013932 [Haemonchus contortus]
MLRFYAFLFGLRLLRATTDECPGWCGHPLEKLIIWTDNPNIWRCELPSITVTHCSDIATVTCLRLDDLGGELYLMLFPDSPNRIGIDPDYLAKGRVGSLNTKIQCKNGSWTLPENNIRITHLLCDQYIIDGFKALNSKNKPLPPLTHTTEKPSTDDDLQVSDVEVPSEAPKINSTESPGSAYLVPISPIFVGPTTVAKPLSRPPEGSYLEPTSPTNTDRNIVKEVSTNIPDGSYSGPRSSAPSSTTQVTSPTSTANTSDIDPTLTTFFSMITTLASKSTTASTSNTSLTPKSTAPSVLKTSTTEMVPSSSPSASSSTTSATVLPSTTLTTRPVISTTVPSVPRLTTTLSSTTVSTSTTPASATEGTSTSATERTTTSASTKARATTLNGYLTKNSSINGLFKSTLKITKSKTTKKPVSSTTKQSRKREKFTQAASTTKASVINTTQKPIINVSFTYKGDTNTTPSDPYGDDSTLLAKPTPQGIWIRKQHDGGKKASKPTQVKLRNRKPSSTKRKYQGKLGRAVRARPLRNDHTALRNYQDRASRPNKQKGRLVGLMTGRRTKQQ